MKVYSWNMLYRNKELDRAFAFIANSDLDVFCLQEVPEAFLERLRSLPYHLHVGTDALRLSSNTKLYLVILSKHPLVHTGRFEYEEPRVGLRARIFVRVMYFFHFTHVSERGGIYADLRIKDKLVRIFCLHLRLSYPKQRIEELDVALANRDRSLPSIVCGDFNILETPHITPLNWMLGGRITDTLFYSRERTVIEKKFVEHELQNPLRGNYTHLLSTSQLDHILVSKDFSITNASVIPDRYGSDHHPICVDIA